MKKQALLVLTGVILLGMAAGCSKGYESQKNLGDMNVTLRADRYPLVMGDNDLSVAVTGKAGKPVTEAAVSVRYYMPPMPGMAPMDFTTEPRLKGNEYAFVANPSMEGGWKVEVSVTPPGAKPATATFNLDAR